MGDTEQRITFAEAVSEVRTVSTPGAAIQVREYVLTPGRPWRPLLAGHCRAPRSLPK